MTVPREQIERVRAFNRDYTRLIGVLSEGLLDSPHSLTEVRVMYEIAHRRDVTAAELADELSVDRGYLSRLLKGLESKKILARTVSAEDGRRQHLRLTAAGKQVLAPLERRSNEQVKVMLTTLDEKRRGAVLEAMELIRDAFDAERASDDADQVAERAGRNAEPAKTNAARDLGNDAQLGKSPRPRVAPGGSARSDSKPHPRVARAGITFRPHRPGDMGWVVQRHGELYHQEYGWNEEFEALVAEITAEFIRKLDVTRERCWIAERDGERLGCIFLVAKDATTAKLRLLLVEPETRGMGVGRALVTECVRFAREAGYRKIVLWTQENLGAARHLYDEAGFKKIAREPHHSFGHDLVAETWELEFPAGAK
jgi:DNA-binding MarR family transcriptional regulator/ribosomal protein S18 acetylase RimI-like enzyme